MGHLQPATLGELFDLLEHERGLVTGARVLMPAAHFGKRGVTLCRRGVPVLALPLRSEELAERIPQRKAHADPVGTQLLDRRGAKILRLADAHASKSLRCSTRGPQAVGGLSQSTTVPTLICPLSRRLTPWRCSAGNQRCRPRKPPCPDAARRSR